MKLIFQMWILSKPRDSIKSVHLSSKILQEVHLLVIVTAGFEVALKWITCLRLTGLVCGDSNIRQWSRCHAQPRDAVHSLYMEGVVGVRRKIYYCHRGTGQTEWPWDEPQVRLTRLTLRHPTVAVTSITALAQDVVGDVLPASRIARRHPLQEESCVVD